MRISLKPCLIQQIRFYTIQPPVWLGGREPVLPWQRKQRRKILPGATMSLEDKLEDEKEKTADPVNIGIPYKVDTTVRREFLSERLKDRTDLEKAARHRELDVPLGDIRDGWMKELGPIHTRQIVQHYGIYTDLFQGAYFYPVVDLRICYDYDDDLVTPVHFGNVIPPAESSSEPHISFDAPEDTLWTLHLTNPDGHLTDNDQEYLHWFVGNIPGGDVSRGEVYCDYLQPFPPKGTGFHRHVFVLYQQGGPIDYSKHKRQPNCASLEERTFNTHTFCKDYQDHLIPMGLRFFQSEWDRSVKDVYHHVLDMREPVFEFDHPPPYHPPQTRYPKRQPFDRYYDRYRDKKDLAEEVVKIKLKITSPFKPYEPEYKYPHMWIGGKPSKSDTKPSWLKRKEELIHRRIEQYRDLPE